MNGQCPERALVPRKSIGRFNVILGDWRGSITPQAQLCTRRPQKRRPPRDIDQKRTFAEKFWFVSGPREKIDSAGDFQGLRLISRS